MEGLYLFNADNFALVKQLSNKAYSKYFSVIYVIKYNYLILLDAQYG